MARKTMATPEAVAAARAALIGEGKEVTVAAICARVGGSYSTISRELAALDAAGETESAQVAEVPSEFLTMGEKAVAAIYAACQREAAGRIEAVASEARKHVDAAERAKAEALAEIERLEGEGDKAAQDLETVRSEAQAARDRAERAEGALAALQGQLDAVRQDLASARDNERLATAAAAELRGELRALKPGAGS